MEELAIRIASLETQADALGSRVAKLVRRVDALEAVCEEQKNKLKIACQYIDVLENFLNEAKSIGKGATE